MAPSKSILFSRWFLVVTQFPKRALLSVSRTKRDPPMMVDRWCIVWRHARIARNEGFNSSRGGDAGHGRPRGGQQRKPHNDWILGDKNGDAQGGNIKERGRRWLNEPFFRRAERTSSLVYKRAVYKRGCHVVKMTAELAAGVGRMEACSRNTRRVLEKRVVTFGQPFSSMQRNRSGESLDSVLRCSRTCSLNRFDRYRMKEWRKIRIIRWKAYFENFNSNLIVTSILRFYARIE